MREDSYSCFLYSESLETEIWKNCVFVLDTSALLELYFYSSASQQKLLENVFGSLKNRLWIPSHVEFEYLKNRQGAIKKPIAEKYKPIQSEGLEELRSHIKILKAKVLDLRQKTQKSETHPYFEQIIFDNFIQAIEVTSNEFETFSKTAIQQIEDRKSEIEALEKNDRVFARLKDFISVGGEYSFSRKMEILAESEIRFRNKIPPGYKDAEGKDAKEGFQKIGDLIIWKQIIDYAAAAKKPIVFVTNDVKEDWCYTSRRSNEVRIERPREELIQEIYAAANVKFWMYNFPQFLYACKKLLNVSIDDNVLEEAKDVARERFAESPKLRFDGVYVQAPAEGGYKFYYYLRFFKDKTVINTSSIKEMVGDELRSFDRNRAKRSGSYISNGDLIAFSASSSRGAVDYSGVVNDDSLTLSSHSHINQSKMNNRVFIFVPFDSVMAE